MDTPNHRDLRNAFGHFPTGVAILTCRTVDGRNAGLTCNSFTSLSLSPPLVLWSLALRSSLLEAFLRAEHFGVNVLSAEQRELSEKFARPVDRFANTSHHGGTGGIPLIDGAVAHFECATEHRYDGGDHIIIVGRVLVYRHFGGQPLVFHRGSYASLSPPARRRASEPEVDRARRAALPSP